MKKLIFIFIFIIAFACTTHAQNLEFTPAGGGYFIYSNNPEAITDDILANGTNPSYIMNNEDLDAGMYHLYLSHFNYTGSGKKGYDVELDTEITAKTDCTITIHDSEFETGRAVSYKKDSTEYRYESDWGCLNVCAGMLDVPIISADGENIFTGHNPKPITITLKKGETTWLSRYLADYKTTHFCMPVHIQAKIEIETGTASLNVAAFRHNGTLGDRSGFSASETAFGSYRRDRCLKGVAPSLPQVSAELSYVIDDSTESGTALPVTIHNQYVPEGAELTKWLTNLNPQDDIWSKRATVENDMLPLYYKDDSKLNFYGKKVTKRDNIWVFDTTRSDTRQYEPAFASSPEYYEPNFKLDVSADNQGYGCSMGNYGVITSYHINVTNTGSKPRYFEYRATTSANLIVYMSDENNDFEFAVAKTMSTPAKTDYLASREISPGETAVFYINTLLPVNYTGGTQNEFVINDEPYTPDYSEIFETIKPKKFYDNTTYVKDYEDILPENTLNAFSGNLESYEIIDSGNIKAARWCAWDGLPNFYYNTWGYSSVFIMDKDFNIISEKAFDSLPVSMTCKDGVFYVTTARNGIFASYGEDWWSVSSIPNEVNFDLNGASEWAKPAIAKMLSKGFIPDNAPSPVLPATRQDFCRIAYTMLSGSGYMNTVKPKSSFSDTTDYACLKLCDAGIVLGTGDGKFEPDKSITREEAAVILSRSADFMNITIPKWNNSDIFKDYDEMSDWAVNHINGMYNLGIMIGTDKNHFSPKDIYTTEQSITTLMRLLE